MHVNSARNQRAGGTWPADKHPGAKKMVVKETKQKRGAQRIATPTDFDDLAERIELQDNVRTVVERLQRVQEQNRALRRTGIVLSGLFVAALVLVTIGLMRWTGERESATLGARAFELKDA